MLLLPLSTPILHAGDNLADLLTEAALRNAGGLRHGDIVVVSSKIVATAEGAAIDLRKVPVTEGARKWASRLGRMLSSSDPSIARVVERNGVLARGKRPPPQCTTLELAFCQAVLDETARMHGRVLGGCSGTMLTEIPIPPASLENSPSEAMGLVGPIAEDTIRGGVGSREGNQGFPSRGSILAANAGLDRSNVEEGFAIGWPRDPVESVGRLRRELESRQVESGKWKIAVILSDSCCHPRRRGVTAFALAVAGLDPIRSRIGEPDLFGRPLAMTQEAVADQLATAANMLMGNAAEGIPAVIVRDHRLALSQSEGWVPGIEPSDDLFSDLLRE